MKPEKLSFIPMIFAFYLCSCTATGAHSEISQSEKIKAELEKCVRSEAQKESFSGVNSIDGPFGRVSEAKGLLGDDNSSALNIDTQFNLGSTGKMFTAVAVGQLVDANKIKLDDRIGKYVSGLSPEVADIKIQQLLSHSGGLGNFFSPENMPQLQKAKTLDDLLPLMADDRPRFTPGARFEYSNNGFLLLGLMIEKVSGKSFADYLKSNIFEPSGMQNSSLEPSKTLPRAIGMTNMPELPPPEMMGPPPNRPMPPPNGAAIISTPMGPPPKGPLRPAIESMMQGNSAGSAYSSASDMHRFFAAFQSGKLTSLAMRNTLTSNQIEAIPARNNMPARYYGLGFGVGSFNGHKWFGHNGGTLGVDTETRVYEGDKTSIVILANRDPQSAPNILRKLKSVLYENGTCQ